MAISKIIPDATGTPVGAGFSACTTFDAYAHSTVDTFGSYVEIDASTSAESRGLVIQVSDNLSHMYTYNFAGGAAGSEVVFGAWIKRGGNPGKLSLGEVSILIEKGSRIAVRAKRSTAGAGISSGVITLVEAGS